MGDFWDKVNRIRETFQKRRELKLKEDGASKLSNILAMHPNPHIRNEFFNQVWMSTQMAALASEVYDSRIEFPDVTINEAIVPGVQVGSNRPTPIPDENFNKPTLLIGDTGSGKSNLAYVLAGGMVNEKRKHFRFVDHANEAHRLPNIFGERAIIVRPDQLTFNLGAPPTEDQAVAFYASTFANLASAFSLQPSNYLQAPEIPHRMLRSRRAGDPLPSLWDIERGFKTAAASGRSKFVTTAYALGAIRTSLGAAALIREGVAPAEPVQGFKLSGLPTRVTQFLNAQLFLIELMTSFATGFTSELKRVLYFDEGLFGFSRQTQTSTPTSHVSVADLLATQPRKHGLSVILGFQSFADIHPAFLDNCGTVFVGRLPQPNVATEAARFLQLPPAVIPSIQTLPPGRFWMRSIGYSGAVLVQVPRVNAGRYLSEATIDELMTPKLARLEKHITRAPAPREEAPAIFYMNDDAGSPVGGNVSGDVNDADPVSGAAAINTEIPLRAEHIAFMRDVAQQPDSRTAERYGRLHLSAGRGNRIKADLYTLGLIESHRRRGENGRPAELLRLTDAGRQAIEEENAR